MGPVRTISSIAVVVSLDAIFGRRARGAAHGEVAGQPPIPPIDPASTDLDLPAEISRAADPSGARPGGPGDEPRSEPDQVDRGRGLRPVPHPIRPWELWHPAIEPVHLFQREAEERVSWSEMADEGQTSDDGGDLLDPGVIDLTPAPVDDIWSEHDPEIRSTPPDDLGTLLDRPRPQTPSPVEPGGPDGAAEAFGFGRMRPFTRPVPDAAQDLGSRTPPSSEAATRVDRSAHPDQQAPKAEHDERPTPAAGDVLFQELVSPERMTASEHALEDQAQPGSVSRLINGPVSRRSGRGRRRLPTGLRVADGEGDRPTAS